MLAEFKAAQGGGGESAVQKTLQGTAFTDSLVVVGSWWAVSRENK